jgi:TPR repeat protein
MYYNGEGVTKGYVEAFKWHSKAAEHGHAGAQAFIGVMYGNGDGVTRDFVLAYKWLYLSAAQGNDFANNGLGALEKQMTPAQIAEARKLSSEFKPRLPE